LRSGSPGVNEATRCSVGHAGTLQPLQQPQPGLRRIDHRGQHLEIGDDLFGRVLRLRQRLGEQDLPGMPVPNERGVLM
jgi:hypothetical protein